MYQEMAALSVGDDWAYSGRKRFVKLSAGAQFSAMGNHSVCNKKLTDQPDQSQWISSDKDDSFGPHKPQRRL